MPVLAGSKRIQGRRSSHHGPQSLAKQAVRGVLKALKRPKHQQNTSKAPSSRFTRQAAKLAVNEAGATVLSKRRTEMVDAAIAIHEDDKGYATTSVKAEKMDHRVQLVSDDEDEAQYSEDGTDSDAEVDESVAEDMRKLEESFKGISQRYRLINKIGEGTFSTVYKAEELPQDGEEDTENDDPEYDELTEGPGSKRRRSTPSKQTSKRRQKYELVALKTIYVTSSPHRILNELELLHELRNSPFICPLITAMRHLDQVVAVLPYFRHLDFRLYYREFIVNDMRHYFRSLFNALHHVHRAGILHRDIKPTNFLYDHSRRHGVLVDFGLAERQGTDWQACHCEEHADKRRQRFINSYAVQHLHGQPGNISHGYPSTKHDQRPSRRANRAGTRGFRAPEVLFKCTAQTTKIDIWSAGVILLTILARRFPFFNSADDVDAMIEIASIFGKKKMQAAAAMHGSVFETNIETIGEKGFTFEKIIVWASCREKGDEEVRAGESQAIKLLQGLLELDPNKRMSAKEALQDDFFTHPVEDEFERDEREEQEAIEEEESNRQRAKR